MRFILDGVRYGSSTEFYFDDHVPRVGEHIYVDCNEYRITKVVYDIYACDDVNTVSSITLQIVLE